ncbi:MAG: phosphohistidine phosphatase SixA [Candidatus Binatia bacterium]
MKLFLLRHGIAVDDDPSGQQSDRERPLSAKGIKRMRKAAQGIARIEDSFDRIVASPYVRAVQTAGILAETLNLEDRVEEVQELALESSAERVIAKLIDYREFNKLLVVGHQPLLGQTVSSLLTGSTGMDIEFKKGGLCCIEVDTLPAKSAALHCLLTSKQLRQIAGS